MAVLDRGLAGGHAKQQRQELLGCAREMRPRRARRAALHTRFPVSSRAVQNVLLVGGMQRGAMRSNQEVVLGGPSNRVRWRSRPACTARTVAPIAAAMSGSSRHFCNRTGPASMKAYRAKSAGPHSASGGRLERAYSWIESAWAIRRQRRSSHHNGCFQTYEAYKGHMDQ
jgi:hypothetical protein